MKHYLVEVMWNDPYPKKFPYRMEGSSIAVGVGKALRQFRKDVRGRRIKALTIKSIMYGSETTN